MEISPFYFINNKGELIVKYSDLIRCISGVKETSTTIPWILDNDGLIFLVKD